MLPRVWILSKKAERRTKMKNFFSLSANGFFGSISEWYQSSVICELLTYLEETYFTVTFDHYSNFSVSSEAGTMVRNIILGLAIGIIIASAMAVHTRRGLGGFVRKLIGEECLSPDQAKTLMELGYFQNFSVRRELKKGVTLCKLVVCKEQEELQNKSSTVETEEQIEEKKHLSEDFEIDFTTCHFYIPEDLRYRAEVRFEKAGSTWRSFIITLILTVISASLLCLFLPDLFRFADNLITWLAP